MLAHGSGGFWPLSYHCGTMWTHDTAVAIGGLARAGLVEQATTLMEQLLAAAPGFGYRLPELFSGDRAEDIAAPAPYPASCRPQAWAAASAVVLLGVALGLDVDVPVGRVRVHPCVPGPLAVEGLRLGQTPLSIAVASDASATIATDAPVQLVTPAP